MTGTMEMEKFEYGKAVEELESIAAKVEDILRNYAAIFGIAFIFPWMQGFWPGNRHEDGRFTRCTRWIWDSAAMSISPSTVT